MVMMVPRVPREPKALLVKTVPQVFVGNVVFQEQTVQKERLVLKALLVSVDCLVSKGDAGPRGVNGRDGRDGANGATGAQGVAGARYPLS